MMLRIKRLIVIGCVLLFIFATSCSDKAKGPPQTTSLPNTNDTIVDNAQLVRNFMDQFLTIRINAEDAEKLLEYVHFENDWEASVYADAVIRNPLVSYEILSSSQLSSNLYVFYIKSITLAGQLAGEEMEQYYNFVALIDGEYQVITHIRNIPQELSENIELSPYSNDNAFTIQPEAVLDLSGD